MKKYLSIFVVFILALVITGCSGEKKEEETREQKEKGEVEKEEDLETLYIGFTGPLSGGAAFYGRNTLSGIELAAKEVNENGGLEVDGKKYHVEVVSLDDVYSPDKALENANSLVSQYNPSIIFTPQSGGIQKLQEINEESNFIVGAYASVPGMTEGNSKSVQIPPRFNAYFEPYSEAAMSNFGDKIAFVAGSHAYGLIWTEQFKETWLESGGKVVYEEAIDYNNSVDFTESLSKAIAKNPDVLFIGGPSEPTALVVKQARDLGFTGGFISTDQAKVSEIANVLGGYGEVEGVIGMLPYESHKSGGTEIFIENYEKEFGKKADYEAAYHYLATNVFFQAMKEAKSTTDTDAIMENLNKGFANLEEEKRVVQVYKTDENNAFVSPVLVGMIKDGEVQVLKEIIFE